MKDLEPDARIKCKHGVLAVSSRGCMNCLIDENDRLRSEIAASKKYDIKIMLSAENKFLDLKTKLTSTLSEKDAKITKLEAELGEARAEASDTKDWKSIEAQRYGDLYSRKLDEVIVLKALIVKKDEALEFCHQKSKESSDCSRGFKPHNPDGDGDEMCEEGICFSPEWTEVIKITSRALALQPAEALARSKAEQAVIEAAKARREKQRQFVLRKGTTVHDIYYAEMVEFDALDALAALAELRREG